MHSQYRIFDFEHRYVNNNKNSDTHLEMQQKSMVHFNSLNLGDVWNTLKLEIHCVLSHLWQYLRIVLKCFQNWGGYKSWNFNFVQPWLMIHFVFYWIEGLVSIIHIMAALGKHSPILILPFALSTLEKNHLKIFENSGGPFQIRSSNDNRPPWNFYQIMQAPRIFFAALQIHLWSEKAPLTKIKQWKVPLWICKSVF